MRAILAALIALTCVACSKADVNKTTQDLKTAGTDIKNDPAVKDLGTDIKVAAKHTGAELKVGADKAKVELSKAGDQAKHSLKDAEDKAKDKQDQAAHHDSDNG